MASQAGPPADAAGGPRGATPLPSTTASSSAQENASDRSVQLLFEDLRLARMRFVKGLVDTCADRSKSTQLLDLGLVGILTQGLLHSKVPMVSLGAATVGNTVVNLLRNSDRQLLSSAELRTLVEMLESMRLEDTSRASLQARAAMPPPLPAVPRRELAEAQPAAREAPSIVRSPSSEQLQALPKVPPQNIVIIDDSLVDCLMAQQNLEHLGHQVASANDGMRGIDILRRHSGEVDLILLDVMMPVVDGVSVLKYLKANPELQPVPVVVASYLLSKDVLSYCLKLGAVDVMTKPYSMTKLHALSARIPTYKQIVSVRIQSANGESSAPSQPPPPPSRQQPRPPPPQQQQQHPQSQSQPQPQSSSAPLQVQQPTSAQLQLPHLVLQQAQPQQPQLQHQPQLPPHQPPQQPQPPQSPSSYGRFPDPL